ncbi:MAG TPA: hypothetical protein VEU08_11340 [Vicinamibacterales bacterium]|nr:hypothetical protein [Vicinamibacterales bacterium]
MSINRSQRITTLAGCSSRQLVVYHHPGLGDALICNGLVHHVADRMDRVYVPCKPEYLGTLRCLYSERPAIEVFPVHDWVTDVDAMAASKDCPVLLVGHELCDRRRFDASFYEQVGIPFDVRYSRFSLPEVIPSEHTLYDRLAPREPYGLMHRENSLGVFTLRVGSTLPMVDVRRRTDPYGNLLAFRRLICDADEIHCINSSVIHLVDGLATKGRLFYHAVRKTDFTLRPCWTVVPYSTHPVAALARRAVARLRLLQPFTGDTRYRSG